MFRKGKNGLPTSYINKSAWNPGYSANEHRREQVVAQVLGFWPQMLDSAMELLASARPSSDWAFGEWASQGSHTSVSSCLYHPTFQRSKSFFLKEGGIEWEILEEIEKLTFLITC